MTPETIRHNVRGPRSLRILLVSCYELGQQPLGIAWPAAFLKRAGFRLESLDLALDKAPDAASLGAAGWDLIIVSTPMHTAMRLAIRFVRSIRDAGTTAHVCLHGHYAELFREHLLQSGVDSVLSAESEEALVRLAERLELGEHAHPHQPAGARPILERIDFPVPDRASLHPLSRYVRLTRPESSMEHLVASVEASRGCRHLCRHCPIPPVYGGRFFVVPRDIVLADIDQLVRQGAGHVHFVDPDFLNGPTHALKLCEEMHRRHPELSFDFTAKVEHLLAQQRLLPRFRELGCLFVTTAVESLSDEVLDHLDKGHRRGDVDRLVTVMRQVGISLRPTWVAFTPWTSRADYVETLDWIVSNELVDDTELIQLTIRLLIPPGSLVLDDPSSRAFLRQSVAESNAAESMALSLEWHHPDPVMDVLHRELVGHVESMATQDAMSHRQGFARLASLARTRLGVASLTVSDDVFTGPAVPGARLTEHWFC